MLLGYGHKGDEPALLAAGVDEANLYIDTPGSTEYLDDLVRRSAREKDIIVVVFLRRLGLTPKARANPLSVFKKRKVKIIECGPLPKPKKTRGAKPAVNRTAEEDAIERGIWLEEGISSKSRLDSIKAATGNVYTRDMMNGRHGTPANPKPVKAPPEPARKKPPKRRKAKPKKK